MRTRVPFIANRIAVGIGGTSGSDVTVLWVNVAGVVTTDAGTGALVGGTQTPMSGTMRCFGLEEAGQSVVRTFQEIQVGDLILDVVPQVTVSIFPGQIQSGVVALDSLAEDGLRFLWRNRMYAQRKVGDGLAAAWEAVMGNVALHRTLLLRKAT
jgi:hypothetical protein